MYSALFALLIVSIVSRSVAWGNEVISIMGDSITYGFGLPNPVTDNWTNQLKAKLPDSYSYNFVKGDSGKTLVRGYPGGSFVDLHYNSIVASKATTTTYIVVLGTNDGKTQNKANTISKFVNDYKGLIDLLVDGNVKNPRVFAATPPPVFANGISIEPDFTNNDIDAMVESLAGYKGTKVIDLNDILMPAYSANKSLYIPDNIHPSVAGGQLLADAVHGAIVPEPVGVGLIGMACAGVFLSRRRRSVSEER